MVFVIFLLIIISISSTSLSISIDVIDKDVLKYEEIKDVEPLQKKGFLWGWVKFKVNNSDNLKFAVITFIDDDNNYWIKYSGLIGGFYFVILPYGYYTVITRWFIFSNTTYTTVDTVIGNYNINLY